MDKASKAFSPEEFEVIANETGALILDTRDTNDFAKGFIPYSINIGLEGNFAQWVGEMIQDVKQQILLITDLDKEEEAITRLSRVGYGYTVGYLKGGFYAWKDSDKGIETVERISPKTFENKLKDEKPLVIDVRKKSDYQSEHVIGAINVPLNEINQHLTQFPKDKPFILHCAGGYRSMIASAILKQRGWNNFVDIIAGFKEISETAIPKSEYVCPTTLL